MADAGRIKVLFVCAHNACRSQMAEGWASHRMGDLIEAHSAGIDAQGVNPIVVKVMAEAGVDISGHRSKTVQELSGVSFDYVITLCREARENLPAPGRKTKVRHCQFDAPPEAAARAKTAEEALDQYRRIRDEIGAFIETLPGALNQGDNLKRLRRRTMSQFDEKAKDWDEKPHRVAMGEAIARAVAAKLGAGQCLRLMDYGCGTGLCSLPLADRCSFLLGVDSSAGMLAQLEAKARDAGLEHVSTRCHDLTAETLAGMEFEVVLCAMTLHHVRDVASLLKSFHSLLSPGGLIAVADLDEEDGSFHRAATGVEHHGFCRECIRERLQDAGFAQVEVETAYEIEKMDASGESRRYSVFLATARKSR